MAQNMTPAEREFELILASWGVPYRVQWVMEPWIADFYLPTLKTVIEVDGAYHAGRENKDWGRSAGLLRRRDVDQVLRVTNEQVFSGELTFSAIMGGDYRHKRPTDYMSYQAEKRAAKEAARAEAAAKYAEIVAKQPRVLVRKPDSTVWPWKPVL
jgi:very-short-patch-repair endonuclease